VCVAFGNPIIRRGELGSTQTPLKLVVNSGALDGSRVLSPIVPPVVLFLSETHDIHEWVFLIGLKL
jgi:hypothetical protein